MTDIQRDEDRISLLLKEVEGEITRELGSLVQRESFHYAPPLMYQTNFVSDGKIQGGIVRFVVGHHRPVNFEIWLDADYGLMFYSWQISAGKTGDDYADQVRNALARVFVS